MLPIKRVASWCTYFVCEIVAESRGVCQHIHPKEGYLGWTGVHFTGEIDTVRTVICDLCDITMKVSEKKITKII